MSGAGFFGAKKLKGAGAVTVAATHNRRESQHEVGATASIDPTRSHLNERLHGPDSAAGVGQLARDLMDAAGVGKLRKDAVRAIEFVFSLPQGHGIDDTTAYFRDCAAWALGHYGGVLLTVDVHNDEAAQHAHVLLLPLLGGSLVGSDALGGPRQLKAAHRALHTAVGARYGLRRASRRLTGEAKQSIAVMVLNELKRRADPVLRSVLWAVTRAAIESNPADYALELGIEIAQPTKPLKTMAQIFTSKGKGANREPKQKENHIGFDGVVAATEKSEPYLSAMVCSPAPSTAPTQAPNDSAVTAPPPSTATKQSSTRPASTPKPAAQPDKRPAALTNVIHWPTTPTPTEPDFVETTVRVRDDQYTPEQFDCDSGEFVLPSAPRPRRRDATDAAVALALAALQHRPRMAC